MTWPIVASSVLLSEPELRMSDSEAPGVTAGSSDMADKALPAGTPDHSSPTTAADVSVDNSTDVAPTRKARRKVEVKPPTEVKETQETTKTEELPSKTSNESTVLQGGWGYWGSWGKSILSTATATVATVGQGLTQVIEKAETSLGIPSPTELSAQQKEEEEGKQQGEAGDDTDEGAGDGTSAVGSAMGMLSSLTSVVQSTGKTVITGGLDALEFIGKKTMDVIAEGDPGFKKTKGLMNRTSTLSQVLREAKEREELQTAEGESCDTQKKTVAHYGMLFDEYQGLSHLEALEILSCESESKVKSVLSTLSGEELAELRVDLQLIQTPFSLVEFDEEEVDENRDEDGTDFLKELTEALDRLHISASADKLGKACKDARSQISEMTTPGREEEDTTSTPSVEDVHAAAIRSLAELTARSIQQFHKVAEILLFSTSRSEVSAKDQATVLSHITVILCKEISLLSKRFTHCLTTVGSGEKGDVLNPLITGVFLEASNSASYIQDAFQLLKPVLEVSHIQRGAVSPAVTS
ncbi:protein FAM114A2 [Lampris incognitus]|uniref:protein FAM114A2 n=1 Tax=Lampris incognitus TaxID=2546036 RepID=UPI0024B5F299|nr:protein FAM114A2 [Lampris incognitus]